MIIMEKKEIDRETFIKSGVDLLVELLKKRKKIYIKEAARELGVSVAVVEEWAYYLEEQEILSIGCDNSKECLFINKPLLLKRK